MMSASLHALLQWCDHVKQALPSATDHENFAELPFPLQLVISTQHLQHVCLQQIIYDSAIPSSLHPAPYQCMSNSKRRVRREVYKLGSGTMSMGMGKHFDYIE